MTNAFSFGAVIALWLGTSFAFWLAHRAMQRRGGKHKRELAARSVALVDEARAIFQTIRQPRRDSHLPHTYDADDLLRDDARILLNTIEAHSTFFDAVKDHARQVQKTFSLTDFAPLSEILQIRRDFWASAEILLMEDLRHLGPEFADPVAYAEFRDEARRLIFGRPQHHGPEDDAVDLRITLAHDEAQRFAAMVEEEIRARAEKERIPRPAEIIAWPLGVIRSIPSALSIARSSFGDFLALARSVAGSMRQSDAVAWSLGELRRAREELPNRFATAFEQAGGLAHQGGQGLKRHYEFLLEARELQARYVEALQRAPDLSEKGKQFLARLELERRAEQMRLGSRGLLSRLRNALVLLIARLITALQHVQAWITPPENKQLARVGPAFSVEAKAAPPQEPIRRPLPPARERPSPAPQKGGQFDNWDLGSYDERKPSAADVSPLPKDNIDRVRALFHHRGATRAVAPERDASAEIRLRPGEFSRVGSSNAPAGATTPSEANESRSAQKNATSGSGHRKANDHDEKPARSAPGDSASDPPQADTAPQQTGGFFSRFRQPAKQKESAPRSQSFKDLLASVDDLEDAYPVRGNAGYTNASPPHAAAKKRSLASRLGAIPEQAADHQPAPTSTQAAPAAPALDATPARTRGSFFRRSRTKA